MSYLELAKKSLAEIRTRAVPSTSGASRDTERAAGFDPDRFAAMRVSEFAHAGLVVQIHSGVLGCDVLFVSDDVPESEIPDLGLTIYRAAEMRKLAIWRPRPADLSRVHAVKEVFGVYGATITAIESKEVHRRRTREGSAKKAKEAKKAPSGTP